MNKKYLIYSIEEIEKDPLDSPCIECMGCDEKDVSNNCIDYVEYTKYKKKKEYRQVLKYIVDTEEDAIRLCESHNRCYRCSSVARQLCMEYNNRYCKKYWTYKEIECRHKEYKSHVKYAHYFHINRSVYNNICEWSLDRKCKILSYNLMAKEYNEQLLLADGLPSYIIVTLPCVDRDRAFRMAKSELEEMVEKLIHTLKGNQDGSCKRYY